MDSIAVICTLNLFIQHIITYLVSDYMMHISEDISFSIMFDDGYSDELICL